MTNKDKQQANAWDVLPEWETVDLATWPDLPEWEPEALTDWGIELPNWELELPTWPDLPEWDADFLALLNNPEQ